MKISTFYEHIVEASEQTGLSVTDICSRIRTYGISGIEIEDKRLFNDSNILKILEEQELEISCIYSFQDFSHHTDTEDGKKLIDYAAANHVKKVMIIPGFLNKLERTVCFIRNHKIKNMIHCLKEISIYAKEKGVCLVLEDFDSNTASYSTEKGLKQFLNSIPELYCAFDTGNFLYSEEDSLQILPKFMEKIRHVHCKDRSLEKKEGEKPLLTIKGRELYSAPVGSGCIRMKEIIQKIKESGYQDYFAIEHFGSKNQLEDMRISAQWIRKEMENYHDTSNGME